MSTSERETAIALPAVEAVATRIHDQPAADPPLAVAKRERFVFVDALRGIAALGVVVYHAKQGGHMDRLAERAPTWSLLPLDYGHLGVPIFYVLSGFVIAYSVGRYRVDASFFARFVARRSLRLDPPYWTSIALVIGFGVLSQAVSHGKRYEIPGAGRLLAHMVYIQEILGYTQLNPIYWTLCVEIQFYLVFCLLLMVAHRFRRDDRDHRSLLALFGPLALVTSAWPLGFVNANVWPGLFPPFWHGFFLGVLACWAMKGTARPWVYYLYALPLGIVAGVKGGEFTLTCVAIATLLLELGRWGLLGRWLSWRGFQFCGMISYSLYLVHNPITGAFYNVAFRLTGHGAVVEAFWFVVMIAVNVVAAWAFWYGVERTSLGWSHRVKLAPGETSGRHVVGDTSRVALPKAWKGEPENA